VLTIGLAVTGAEAQPTVTVTMRLAEVEWHVVRQEVLPRFEAVSTTVSGLSTSHQKLWCNACGQCSRPGAWRLTSLRRTICVFRNWSTQPWLPRSFVRPGGRGHLPITRPAERPQPHSSTSGLSQPGASTDHGIYHTWRGRLPHLCLAPGARRPPSARVVDLMASSSVSCSVACSRRSV
jgi:hypothetical protein